MNRIRVNTSREYDILIDSGLLKTPAAYLSEILCPGCKLAIISDSNVWPIYGPAIKENLSSAGCRVCEYVFPAGESSKNSDTYLKILNFLAKNHITRSDAVIALGGGVTGDMAGFAAATFLRGIRYIQMPTSLLAMVDSSVGGKTAIDLPAGKNLLGAFHQPAMVLCDIDALSTLPKSVFCDGCAEVIKYGVLFDKPLFVHLEENGLHFDRKAVISRCVELKRDIVCADEFDAGLRQKLNLGHTIGHSIEAKSNFTITHGQAVAIGMAIVSMAGCKEIYPRVTALLKKFGLPFTTDFTAKELAECALSDKKRTGGTINLIIPNAIGDCAIVPTPVEQVESFIKEGLSDGSYPISK